MSDGESQGAWDTTAALSSTRTLGNLIRRQALDKPRKEALLFEQRATTYRELDELSNRVGNGLVGDGLGAGSRVAVIDKNSDLFFQILFGSTKTAVVFVSVNWRLSAPEIAYILNDSRAEVLFVGSDFHALIEQVEQDLPAVKRIVALDGDHPRWLRFEQWRDSHSADDVEREVGPEDVAVQMYTSGTTGNPKGVQLMHKGFFDIWREPAYQEIPSEAPCEDTVNLVVLPNFHIGAIGWALRSLREGATGVILREFDPGRLLEAVERYRVKRLVLVPAAIRSLLQHPKVEETDLSSLQFVRYGGSPIPLELLREAVDRLGCGFVQLYAMTETGGTGTYLPPEDHDPNGNERMRSAGKPQPGVEIKVVDASHSILGPREVGEVCIRSPSNMKGYWKLPAATETTLIDGFVHTGDAGFVDEDGYVYIQDRLKDMIVSGGENVYPAEVENVLSSHPDIDDVAVIGVPDPRWGEAVKAIVVLRKRSSASAEELIAYARASLAVYKLPKSVDFVEELPRNPSGKILKRELRKPYWKGIERGVN